MIKWGMNVFLILKILALTSTTLFFIKTTTFILFDFLMGITHHILCFYINVMSFLPLKFKLVKKSSWMMKFKKIILLFFAADFKDILQPT